MKKLTKKKAIELHRELWDWLFRHPSKYKEDWPRWDEITKLYGRIQFRCFPCHFTYQQCEKCILDWNSEVDTYCKCIHKTLNSIFVPYEQDDAGDGYFGKWSTALTPKTRKKYAKIIRDLEVKS